MISLSDLVLSFTGDLQGAASKAPTGTARFGGVRGPRACGYREGAQGSLKQAQSRLEQSRVEWKRVDEREDKEGGAFASRRVASFFAFCSSLLLDCIGMVTSDEI